MRFIRKEHVITTIYNKDIKEDSTIKVVLEKLLERKIEFSLTIRKYFPSILDYKTINHSKARIKLFNMENRTVDFYVYEGGTLITIKNILIDDIVEINATTTKSSILESSDDVSRFALMDIE